MRGLRETHSLAPLTTLRVGGPARFFAECATEEEIQEAVAYARIHTLPLLPLGGGSNILVPDEGVEALVAKIEIGGISFDTDSGVVRVVAGAGVSWDELVKECAARGLWGIENLAGIPGTVGAAPIQNIGAYGAELSDVFHSADAVDVRTSLVRRLSRADASFSYRDSIFKRERDLVVVRIALQLSRAPAPNLRYRDLVAAERAGAPLTTPSEIGEAVRIIRASKFPDLAREGTAGSFFKNPILAPEEARALRERFPGLPTFSQSDGRVKVPLAWILDHVLKLRGLAIGSVRLFEHQPLVIVASAGASAREVEQIAREVANRTREATGIVIEREVETFAPHA